MRAGSADADLGRLLPCLRRDGEWVPLDISVLPLDDLFADPTGPKAVTAVAPRPPGSAAAVSVAKDLIVSFRRGATTPGLIQSFVAGLFDRWVSPGQDPGGLEPVLIDPEADLVVWMPRAAEFAAAATRLWTEISCEGRPDPLDGLTTPSIYGNKLRIARMLHAVFVAEIPEGSPVLDVMSGTGIVTRMLARRHAVTANDANPYAALLTRVQSVAFAGDGERIASDLLRKLRGPWSAHANALRERYAPALDSEKRFLHGDLNEASLDQYRAFVQEASPNWVDGTHPTASGDLITARYANVYFGVAQAIEIDAIRVAIDDLTHENPARRDLRFGGAVAGRVRVQPRPAFRTTAEGPLATPAPQRRRAPRAGRSAGSSKSPCAVSPPVSRWRERRDRPPAWTGATPSTPLSARSRRPPPAPSTWIRRTPSCSIPAITTC